MSPQETSSHSIPEVGGIDLVALAIGRTSKPFPVHYLSDLP